MKTKTIITEIEHDDLVDLLSTATYGSDYMVFDYREDKGLAAMWECAEDIAAEILLHGGRIYILDYNAEDEDEIYSDMAYWDEDRGTAVYGITLEDIKRGLQLALDGEVKEGGAWLRECAIHLLTGEGDMDYPEANALMQVIAFGDLIYG